MNYRLFAEWFTLIVLTYWACRGAVSFGGWLGWLLDPEQWPRTMVALLLDLFRWDRSVSKVQMKAWEVFFDYKFVDGGRAPRGTP